MGACMPWFDTPTQAGKDLQCGPGGPGAFPPQGSHRPVRARIRAYGSSSNSFASPGPYAAANPSFVIRWLYGNTRLRVQSLSGGARQRRSYSMPRFPSTGSLRVKFPGFIGNIKALRLPVACPAVLRCLRLALPRSHSLDFAPRRASAPPRPGVDHPVSPAGNLRGDDRISQVPGESPLSICTCSCRHRQDCSHQTITVPQRGPWTPRCKGSHERSFDAQ